jgi:hypothetical protein
LKNEEDEGHYYLLCLAMPDISSHDDKGSEDLGKNLGPTFGTSDPVPVTVQPLELPRCFYKLM